MKAIVLKSPLPKKLIIVSRESRLAMWQAEHVRDQLAALYPECVIEILGMTTRGDQILDRALSKVGGKGLFVKELEVAISEERADLAVHSLKDVPMDLPEGFSLAAVLEREADRACERAGHQLARDPRGPIRPAQISVGRVQIGGVVDAVAVAGAHLAGP